MFYLLEKRHLSRLARGLNELLRIYKDIEIHDYPPNPRHPRAEHKNATANHCQNLTGYQINPTGYQFGVDFTLV